MQRLLQRTELDLEVSTPAAVRGLSLANDSGKTRFPV